MAFGRPQLREDVPFLPNDEFVKDVAKLVTRDDRIIFAGGGLFWSDEHIRIMLSIAERARSNGCEVRVERVGAQGIHLDLEASRRLLSLCSFISVRDANSVDLLRRLNVTHRAFYVQDFVLDLDYNAEQSRLSRPTIGINHSATPFFHNPSHREKALQIYTDLAQELSDLDFVYVPHTVHFSQADQNDESVGEAFHRNSDGRIQTLPFPAHAEDLIDYYSGLTVAIGWRYHLNVLCKFVGIPSAIVCQDDEHKYRAFGIEHRLPIFNFDESTENLVRDIRGFIRCALVKKGS
nr:polysaccharide pyruvyl transferase family protein [Agrobacterium rosae]MDX8316899.1 polysaccharide pyruvyl transferase family protein [Agrobacterium rosae]MDX8316928.1 polysaccharide pyruvyl transferase family protein [Agrobacterium rosae]